MSNCADIPLGPKAAKTWLVGREIALLPGETVIILETRETARRIFQNELNGE